MKWASIEFAFNALFRFSVKLVLAKILLPNDFGLVGMSSIFIAIASAASELGMGAALIQKKNDDEAEGLFNTAFWSGLVWGVVIFAIISLVVAPMAADFYKEPILITLIPVLSIGIILSPLNLVHNVILTRSMNFKKIAMVNNMAALVAGVVGIVAAYYNMGVWALALNNLLVVVIAIPLLFWQTRWIPKLYWNKDHFKVIFGFGVYSTGTSIFSRITYSVDNLVIGKMLGSNALGAYTLSFSLTENLRQTISSILNKVMYPVFGKYQDDPAKLKRYFLKIININSIIIYPIMVFLFLFAKDLIEYIFGNSWVEAIIPLQILSVAVMVHLIVNSFTALLRGMGHPGLEFKIISLLVIFVLVPGLYFGIEYYGLAGASLAILLNKIALVIVSIVVLNKYINIRFIEIFQSIKGALFSILIAGLSIIFLKLLIPEFPVVLQMLIYVLIYVLSIFIFEKKVIGDIYLKVLNLNI